MGCEKDGRRYGREDGGMMKEYDLKDELEDWSDVLNPGKRSKDESE
jgi:hypothetical protein